MVIKSGEDQSDEAEPRKAKGNKQETQKRRTSRPFLKAHPN